MKPPSVLRDLTVEFGSVVDKGANPGADIVLFKRADTDPIATAADALTVEVGKVGRKISGARMTRLRTAMEQLKAAIDGCDPESKDEESDMAEKATKTAEEKATEKVEEKAPEAVEAKAEKAETKSVEDVAKRLADLEKRAADAEARAKAAEDVAKSERDTRVTGEWIAKAAAYDALPIKAAEFGPVLKRAADVLKAEDVAEIERVLKAANEIARTSELFIEKGRAGGEAASATDRLNKLASDMVAEKKADNYAAAIALITKSKEHAGLLAEYEAERN